VTSPGLREAFDSEQRRYFDDLRIIQTLAG
jgi:hypothetical protein